MTGSRTTMLVAAVAAWTLAPSPVRGAGSLPSPEARAPRAVEQPLAGVGVLVKNNAGAVVLRASADVSGTFRLGELPPGSYTVVLDEASLRTSVRRQDPKLEGPPNIIAVLVALLLPARTKVGAGTLTLSRAPASRAEPTGPLVIPFVVSVAVGDVNGDGRAELRPSAGPASKRTYVGTITLVR
ncbi:MAG: hypothetical protein JWO05_2384 [Gemmatimonadetes bacterium]|nr:hypothetical protein [Gemmatimonadota bacterium]